MMWPMVDYADSPGVLIGFFASVLFASGAVCGGVVGFVRSETGRTDEHMKRPGGA